jgi:hypothetical protein
MDSDRLDEHETIRLSVVVGLCLFGAACVVLGVLCHAFAAGMP